MPPQLVLARAIIQYKGPRARGIQHVPPHQRDESLEWRKTLQDLEKVQLKNATFIPVEYEVVWQSGLMVVSWLFAKDSELLKEFRLLMRVALRRVTAIGKESHIQSMRYSEVPHVDNGPRVHNTSPSRTQANRTPSASMWDKPPPPVEPAPQQPPPPVGPPPNDLPPPVNPPRNQSSSSNLHRPPPSSTLPPKPISNLPPKPTSFPQLPTSNKPMLTRKAYNRPSPPHSNSQEFLPTDMNKPTPPVSSNRNHGEPTQFPTPIVNTNVSASYTHPPKDLRVPLVSPATLPNGAGPRSPSQPIKVGIKRKYTEVNEIPDRGGERKAPEPPKSGDESSRSAASNPSEATRDRQLLVHVRRVAGELKKRETILSAAIEVEKKENVSLQSELSQVRMKFSELERSYKEERINRTNAEAKLNEEARHRLRVEKTLQQERSENDEYKKKIIALNLDLAKQHSDMISEGSRKDAERLKQLHEVCTQRKEESERANTLSESLKTLKQDKELIEERLREEVSKREEAEEKLEQSRLEAESSAFVVPALKEAFQQILGFGQRVRADLRGD